MRTPLNLPPSESCLVFNILSNGRTQVPVCAEIPATSAGRNRKSRWEPLIISKCKKLCEKASNQETHSATNSAMTNHTPRFSVQVQFDSVRDRHDDFLVPGGGGGKSISLAPNNKIQEALLPLETRAATAENPAGMDQQISVEGAATKKNASSISNKKAGEAASATAAKQRRIGFVLDEKKKIIEEVFEYEAAPREAQQYTDEELDVMLTNAMLVARDFTRNRKDWQNKIKFLMKGCSARDLKTEKPTPLKGEDLDFVVDSDSRGLELFIHPMFQKSRVKAMQSVVKVQNDYNASEKMKGTKDPELRVKVLRAQSMKYTQAARLLAKTLATGDTRAAKKGDEITQNQEEEVKTPQEEESAGNDTPVSAQPSEKATESEEEEKGASSARPNLRDSGLSDLRKQHTQIVELSPLPGAGGIGSLQATLADLTDDEASC